MKIGRSVIEGATDEQLIALRDNVLKDKWTNVWDDDIRVVQEWGQPGDALIVILPNITIGIEADGYTHS